MKIKKTSEGMSQIVGSESIMGGAEWTTLFIDKVFETESAVDVCNAWMFMMLIAHVLPLTLLIYRHNIIFEVIFHE